MSHGPQEERLRDVRKILKITNSRKTSQEANEELSARNPLDKGAAGGIRTHAPLHYTCAL
jgi:hypothetical protein